MKCIVNSRSKSVANTQNSPPETQHTHRAPHRDNAAYLQFVLLNGELTLQHGLLSLRLVKPHSQRSATTTTTTTTTTVTTKMSKKTKDITMIMQG